MNHNSYFAHETAVVDEPCEIGAGTKIWDFTHVMSHCKIGENCNLGQNVVISPEVVLGNNVKIQNNVSIYTGVTCEDDVFLGPSCVFTNVTNPRSAVNRRWQYARAISTAMIYPNLLPLIQAMIMGSTKVLQPTAITS